MSEFDNWIAQQENDHIFDVGESGCEAERMLEYSESNRVVTTSQASFCVALRTAADDLMVESEAWQWLSQYADRIELYQLTVGVPKNSRDMYASILTGYMPADKETKKKGIL